ncbi:hypothetical protein SOPP22_04015 [Shewanella sp. OPT22]|nr:hypothetical protein SOPP22_04015 [Shewanella sp. OPT22]
MEISMQTFRVITEPTDEDDSSCPPWHQLVKQSVTFEKQGQHYELIDIAGKIGLQFTGFISSDCKVAKKQKQTVFFDTRVTDLNIQAARNLLVSFLMGSILAADPVKLLDLSDDVFKADFLDEDGKEKGICKPLPFDRAYRILSECNPIIASRYLADLMIQFERSQDDVGLSDEEETIERVLNEHIKHDPQKAAETVSLLINNYGFGANILRYLERRELLLVLKHMNPKIIALLLSLEPQAFKCAGIVLLITHQCKSQLEAIMEECSTDVAAKVMAELIGNPEMLTRMFKFCEGDDELLDAFIEKANSFEGSSKIRFRAKLSEVEVSELSTELTIRLAKELPSEAVVAFLHKCSEQAKIEVTRSHFPDDTIDEVLACGYIPSVDRTEQIDAFNAFKVEYKKLPKQRQQQILLNAHKTAQHVLSDIMNN